MSGYAVHNIHVMRCAVRNEVIRTQRGMSCAARTMFYRIILRVCQVNYICLHVGEYLPNIVLFVAHPASYCQ